MSLVSWALSSGAGCCARQGALPSACGTVVDRSKFVSLSCSTGYATARGEVPEAALWMGAERVHLVPTQPLATPAGWCLQSPAGSPSAARAR